MSFDINDIVYYREEKHTLYKVLRCSDSEIFRISHMKTQEVFSGSWLNNSFTLHTKYNRNESICIKIKALEERFKARHSMKSEDF